MRILCLSVELCSLFKYDDSLLICSVRQFIMMILTMSVKLGGCNKDYLLIFRVSQFVIRIPCIFVE